MNQFIEQLAARNLEEPSQSLRPRLGSRFEPIRPVQHDALEESVPTTEQPYSVPQFQNQDWPASVSDPSRSFSDADESTQSPNSPSPIVQQNFHTEFKQSAEQTDLDPTRYGNVRLESLAGRLDQLDSQVGRFRIEKTQLPTPVTSPESPRTTELNPNITHFNQITNIQQVPAMRREPLRPAANAQDESSRYRSQEPPSITTVVQQVPTPVLNRPPTESANKTAPKPIVEAVQQKTSPAQPIPSIIVESELNRSSEQKHTVTVTIGRIEVRAPQQPATPTPRQTEKPAARIMSLDDYVKRRAGGAG